LLWRIVLALYLLLRAEGVFAVDSCGLHFLPDSEGDVFLESFCETIIWVTLQCASNLNLFQNSAAIPGPMEWFCITKSMEHRPIAYKSQTKSEFFSNFF
jgi:hypothetical protein